jgi:hypothetical protein
MKNQRKRRAMFNQRGTAMPFARIVALTLALGSVSPRALAQPPTPQDAVPSPGSAMRPRSSAESKSAAPALFSLTGDRVGHGSGVETSLLWPFFPGSLFQLRAVLPVAFEGRGQLLLGAQGHVPHTRSEEGRFSTLAAHLGFRTYLWKGLHVDAMTNLGVGRLRGSVVDGKDYDSFDAELLACAGWRFEAGPVYALVQPLGMGAVVYRSNPWTIVGEGRRTTEPPIFVGNVLLGTQF